MNDYIKREDAINGLAETMLYKTNGDNEVAYMLRDLPPADVVEVVRCKDCKHWLPHTQCGFDEDNDEYHNYCDYHMPDDEWYAGYWEADDYCSYGEPKEQKHE